MAYLRLDSRDYETFCRLCRTYDLGNHSLPTFKRLLLLGLADHSPRLAEDVAALSRRQLRLLYDRVREGPPVERGHGLSGVEVEAVRDSGVPLVSQCRFFHLLKRALVRRLVVSHAIVAAKVDRMSLGQFQGLCQEVRARGREGP
jgi:hypothetical protein